MTMSNENSRFAVELRSACARIQQMVVPHLYFRQAKQRLLEALDTSNLVLLVGPSAVGKGTLIRAVIEKFNAPVERNPKAIRAITVRAPSPQSSRFPWKAFWIACLDAMFDPLPERKVSHGPLYKQSDSIDILKRAVFSAVRDRGVKLIVVDEAMNLVMKERGGQTLRSRLDVLRDISDEAGCAFLLVSTPRILEPGHEWGALRRFSSCHQGVCRRVARENDTQIQLPPDSAPSGWFGRLCRAPERVVCESGHTVHVE